MWVRNLLSSLKGNQLHGHHRCLWVQDLAQPACSRERPLLGGPLSTLPQWQSLTCSHKGSGFGSRRRTGLYVSLTLPMAAWVCLRGWPGLQKTLHRGYHSHSLHSKEKWQQENKLKHQQDSLQGHVYNTLASSFQELKLIVSDNRDKSTVKLPA